MFTRVLQLFLYRIAFSLHFFIQLLCDRLYNLNYGTNYATQVNENVIENVIEISEEKMKQLMPEYSKKKLTKACEILKMISENPNISIDELRIALDVTDRTIARYISELKDNRC